MPIITFYRQARQDGGLRTGIEIDHETLVGHFEDGPGAFNPLLTWYVDVECEGAGLPTTEAGVRDWLLSQAPTVTRGLHMVADEIGLGMTRTSGRFSARCPAVRKVCGSRSPVRPIAVPSRASWPPSCVPWRMTLRPSSVGSRPPNPPPSEPGSRLMPKLLDTSVLIHFWQRQIKNTPLDQASAADARKWAEDLEKVYKTRMIVTPVKVEFLAGVRGQHELELARAHLGHFRIWMVITPAKKILL